VRVRLLLCTKRPSLEGGRETTCVGDVLAKSQPTVDVKGLLVRPGNSVVGVLIYKALGALLEGLDCRIAPPVGVISVLIIVATRRVEGVRELVASNGAKSAIGDIGGDVDIKDRELHDAGGEL